MSQFPPRAFIRMATEMDAADKQQPEPGADPRHSAGELRFLSLRHVLERLTISRSLFYELIKDPVQPFPPPIHIGRRSVWEASEVEAYMQSILQQARGKA